MYERIRFHVLAFFRNDRSRQLLSQATVAATRKGWLLRCVPNAETPDELVTAINTGFLKDQNMRPHEPLKVCFKLDAVRDWKTFLSAANKRVVGLLGPSAPHVFEFTRRDSILPKNGYQSLFSYFQMFTNG